MWDLPGPGIEPVSPALAGGFLTTAPPEKSPLTYFFIHHVYSHQHAFVTFNKSIVKIYFVSVPETQIYCKERQQAVTRGPKAQTA